MSKVLSVHKICMYWLVVLSSIDHTHISFTILLKKKKKNNLRKIINANDDMEKEKLPYTIGRSVN
jgi:hypothetical protein